MRFTAYLHVFNMHEPQRETAVSAWVSSKLQDEDGCISGTNKSTLKITQIALIFRESPNLLGFPICSFHFCFLILLRLTFNFHVIERQDIPFAHCQRLSLSRDHSFLNQAARKRAHSFMTPKNQHG